METMTKSTKAISLKDVVSKKEASILTGIENVDNWLSASKGFVVPSAIFLTGSSGAGKTTLMVYLMSVMKDYRTSLYSREMIKESVKDQTKDISIEHDNAFISDKNSCKNFDEYMNFLDEVKPRVVVIDSLQAIAQEDYSTMSEDAASLMIVSRLRNWIEQNNAVLILIGHVTKDDVFAGRNTIMQYMDVHIEMIYHKKENYRTISFGQKNRKGPMGQLFYKITGRGIEFFTQEEWEMSSKKEIRILSDVIASVQRNFDLISHTYKKEAWFKDFSKEINKELAKLRKQFENDENMTELEYMNDYFIIIKSYTEKYGINAGI